MPRRRALTSWNNLRGRLVVEWKHPPCGAEEGKQMLGVVVIDFVHFVKYVFQALNRILFGPGMPEFHHRLSESQSMPWSFSDPGRFSQQPGAEEP